MSKKDIIRMAMLILALLVFGSGCQKLTPEQEAEKAFTKVFENEYPDWKVTKIILSPCQGANMYRGRFDCEARTTTQRCWVTKEELDYGAKAPSSTSDIPTGKLYSRTYWINETTGLNFQTSEPLPQDNFPATKLVPCSETHYEGEKKMLSVLVTYAHGDCYYKLGKNAEVYE